MNVTNVVYVDKEGSKCIIHNQVKINYTLTVQYKCDYITVTDKSLMIYLIQVIII